MNIFEGLRPADDYAQMNAKKEKKAHYTVLRKSGGLSYVVLNDEKQIQETDKLLSSFDEKGERTK
jgi:hypothetical protein